MFSRKFIPFEESKSLDLDVYAETDTVYFINKYRIKIYEFINSHNNLYQKISNMYH
jgi:hypothetical protein